MRDALINIISGDAVILSVLRTISCTFFPPIPLTHILEWLTILKLLKLWASEVQEDRALRFLREVGPWLQGLSIFCGGSVWSK